MTSAEANYRLLQEIQANRDFLLLAYRQNPELLKRAEPDIRLLFGLPEHDEAGAANPHAQTDPQRK
ncbi:MAG: hypothetical protein EFKGCFLK_01118 [Rhodocyclaceae bacterium]|nr:MAG: hypothetical protein F9K21_13560 [Rhodocyclaceae bacterium]MBV6407551.1 hypothetical protein [Rhodocyclaceae bacterium]CAG0934102.1 hypothetical protein RHDC3_02807 [Rhodocyclaceae bacterium]